MPDVITIGGSPSAYSKSSVLLEYTRKFIEAQGLSVVAIQLREIPAEDLLLARVEQPILQHNLALVAQARAVVFATPIYKASYSGLLKTFLDLLPQNGLANKVVLPLATAGSAAHTLALEYALKPVLGALGVRHFLPGVFITDSQLAVSADFKQLTLPAEIEERLHRSLQELVHRLAPVELPHRPAFNYNEVLPVV